MKLTSKRTAMAVAVALGLAGSVSAQERETPMLDRGTQELSVAGRIDIPELDEWDYDLDGSYGYFIRDGWEVGVQVAAADLDGQDRLELSGFTEYNFRREHTWVPYVGAGIGLVSANFDDDIDIGTPIDDDDGLLFDVEGGVKYFMRPYMAISLAIDFKFSTENVFETGQEIKDNLSSIKVGMRYYF
ncbi:MAG: outer membrane protein [Gammaproteobacteria bacterium]